MRVDETVIWGIVKQKSSVKGGTLGHVPSVPFHTTPARHNTTPNRICTAFSRTNTGGSWARGVGGRPAESWPCEIWGIVKCDMLDGTVDFTVRYGQE